MAEPDTERRILDAAHEVFSEKGTAGARMREVAERAGVNPALLHYYYRTKERLAAAAFERAAKQFMPQVLDVLRSPASLEAKVREVVDLELSTLMRLPYVPGYVLSELSHHADRAAQLAAAAFGEDPRRAAATVLRVLDDQIREAAERGELRAIPAADFVVNLLSLCIFPFAARPMLSALFGLDEARFRGFIEGRRASLPDFFMRALAP
ncbi:MAG: TetR/AcrR family transcriptional regulator [Longimicrobiales bacterium]